MYQSDDKEFIISDYIPSTEKLKSGYYQCPSCGECKLSIAKNGKDYDCYHCHDTKAIASVLTEAERIERKRRWEESQRLEAVLSGQDRVLEFTNGSCVSQSLTMANIRQSSDRAEEVKTLLGWKWYKGTQGWYCFSINPVTGKLTNRGQFKPDRPVEFGDKPAKYISFPQNSKPEAIYLKVPMADWERIADKYNLAILPEDIDHTRDDLGFWAWVARHPEIPVCLTEGIKKAGCLLSIGFVGIALMGVTCGAISGEVLATLRGFFSCDRIIYLVFDADVMVKHQVHQALTTLCDRILSQYPKVIINIVQWNLDLGKGIDDLVAREGEQAAVIEIYNARAYKEWASDKTKGNIPQTTPETKLDPEDNVGDGTFEKNVYKTLFGSGGDKYAVIHDAFYKYTCLGYWDFIPDEFINKLIVDKSFKAYQLKGKRNGEPVVSYPFATDSKVTSAFKFNRKALTITPESKRSLRAFTNCTVDLATNEILAHDPKHYLTTFISVEYKPNAICPETFRNFIVNAYGEDLLETVQAITSMLLDPTAPYGKFPHIIGGSGTGKGTLARFWCGLLGDGHSRSGNSFSELATPEGRHQHLTGVSLFALPDLGGYVQGIKAFYELVDNGAMSGRALFNSHGYQKHWDVRFVVCSVDHLQIENSGDGWDRRVIPLPTKTRKSEEDPSLGNKLASVRADVISWALSMPKTTRDRLLLSRSNNERIITEKQAAAIYSDSVRSFVDLCLRPADGNTLENWELHELYISYCKMHGYIPMAMCKFISHLKTILPHHRVDRVFGKKINGVQEVIPAHWKNLETLRSAFTPSNSGLNPTCIKSGCQEGGLSILEEWNQINTQDKPNTQGNFSNTQGTSKVPVYNAESTTQPNTQDTQGNNPTFTNLIKVGNLTRITTQGSKFANWIGVVIKVDGDQVTIEYPERVKIFGKAQGTVTVSTQEVVLAEKQPEFEENGFQLE